MIIERSIDIENEVRKAFGEMLVCYCRPLPKDFETPCVLVQQVGGSDLNRIDTFAVVLDARARSEAQALLTLRTAVGILREVARQQTTKIRHVTVNSSGSWGNDPVRPDLAMCSARLSIVAHPENVEVDENDS